MQVKKISTEDPMGAELMSKFFHPYLTYTARIHADFGGTFYLSFDANLPYTHYSQYIVNARLTGARNSNLAGNDQDNILQGNSGNNTLDGMAGTDTAVFAGKRNEYIVSRTGDEIKVSISARDSITFLKNIEVLKFSDQVVNASDMN